ncbi:hypothetical protein GCM10027275_38600 [Rhabdobacter roseus]
MLSCQDHNIEDPDPEAPAVDSAQVIASLTAPGRYWCLEQITRTVGDVTEDISEDSVLFTRLQVWYAHANAYQFLDWAGNRTLFESPQESVIIKSSTYDYSDGVSGNRPYGTAELIIREAFIYVGPFHGKWDWDKTKQTVSVQLPTGPILFWKADKGYLDRDMLPKYKSLEEAQDASKPERIRIILEEQNEGSNKVTYAYTLRAAWIIQREEGTPRELSKYIVLY